MLDISDSLYRLSDMKTEQRIPSLENKIKRIKTQLLTLGDMRPGSLSQQYNVCGKPGCRCKDPKNPKRHGPYYQLSYVHRGQSTSQFIRPELRATVRAQTATFKKFRKLTDQWIDLALTVAKLKLDAARQKAS
ncbi:MAG: hypothetical protein HY915_11820 [Desulfovibrio sp.]|nr:hypothetical protein [Desulfovibrio sp.]